MASHTRSLRRALGIAKGSKCKQRLGALLVNGGRKIISEGVNRRGVLPQQFSCYTTLNGMKRASSTTHAEVDCLIGADPKKITGGTLYIARVLANGSPGMSKPCRGCQAVLSSRGVKMVVFTVGGLDDEGKPSFDTLRFP